MVEYSMGKRFYIETSVISYLAAWPSPDVLIAASQEITRDWWDNQQGQKYELFASELVLAEAGEVKETLTPPRGEREAEGISHLEITDEAVALAEKLVKEAPARKRPQTMRCTLPWRPSTR